MSFHDRAQAGAALAAALKKYRGDETAVIVALPRGGVVVGAAIARELNLALDLVVPRKIAHPSNPEYAYGAIAEDGSVVWGEEGRQDGEWVSRVIAEEKRESERRLRLYRGQLPPRDFAGKTLIIVDDGVATGLTMEAAIKTAASMAPARVVVAVPHGARESLTRLRSLVDELVVLESPAYYGSVGSFYQDFPQVSDQEVIAYLIPKP